MRPQCGRANSAKHQIIAILQAVEAGRAVKDVCREHEISDAIYYQWKSKYGAMQASDIKRLRELEDKEVLETGLDISFLLGELLANLLLNGNLDLKFTTKVTLRVRFGPEPNS